MLLKSVSDFENETRFLYSILESSPREAPYFYYDGKYFYYLFFIHKHVLQFCVLISFI